jgi:hypothetical protein
MCGIKRVGNLGTHVDDEIQTRRTRGQPLAKILAFQQLHRQKSVAVLFANFVNCADVGVIKR